MPHPSTPTSCIYYRRQCWEWQCHSTAAPNPCPTCPCTEASNKTSAACSQCLCVCACQHGRMNKHSSCITKRELGCDVRGHAKCSSTCQNTLFSTPAMRSKRGDHVSAVEQRDPIMSFAPETQVLSGQLACPALLCVSSGCSTRPAAAHTVQRAWTHIHTHQGWPSTLSTQGPLPVCNDLQ